MKLSQFQFNLPKDKIAQEPPRWRDECKLMVLHKDSGEIEHRLFKDIIDYFGKGDTFVLNDTKVFPAQLSGNKEKTGAEIDVFLLRELNREQRLQGEELYASFLTVAMKISRKPFSVLVKLLYLHGSRMK